MNKLEERVAAAYQAAASTVTRDLDVPDLAGPSHRGGWSGRGSRALGVRLAAPLGAAAAVAAIAVVLSVIATSGPGPAARQRSGTLPWRLPAATAIRQGYPGNRIPDAARPGYFVGLQPTRPTDYAFTAFVYSTASGRRTGQVTLPAGQWARAVASVGDGTYVVAASRSWPRFGCRTWLYQFRLSAAGRPAGLKPFVVGQVPGWALQLAGSADGRMLDLITNRCTHAHNQGFSTYRDVVTSITLPSGRATTWSPWPAGSNLVPENTVPSATLDADGRLFPFAAIAERQANDALDGQAAYVMRTGPVGGPPARRYHLVLKAPTGVLSAVLSPNGRVTFALTARRYGGRWHEQLGAYATANGKLIKVLATTTARFVNADGYLMPDASGRYLLVLGLGAGNTATLDIATGRLSAVPVRYSYPPLAASW